MLPREHKRNVDSTEYDRWLSLSWCGVRINVIQNRFWPMTLLFIQLSLAFVVNDRETSNRIEYSVEQQWLRFASSSIPDYWFRYRTRRVRERESGEKEIVANHTTTIIEGEWEEDNDSNLIRLWWDLNDVRVVWIWIVRHDYHTHQLLLRCTISSDINRHKIIFSLHILERPWFHSILVNAIIHWECVSWNGTHRFPPGIIFYPLIPQMMVHIFIRNLIGGWVNSYLSTEVRMNRLKSARARWQVNSELEYVNDVETWIECEE